MFSSLSTDSPTAKMWPLFWDVPAKFSGDDEAKAVLIACMKRRVKMIAALQAIASANDKKRLIRTSHRYMRSFSAHAAAVGWAYQRLVGDFDKADFLELHDLMVFARNLGSLTKVVREPFSVPVTDETGQYFEVSHPSLLIQALTRMLQDIAEPLHHFDGESIAAPDEDD